MGLELASVLKDMLSLDRVHKLVQLDLGYFASEIFSIEESLIALDDVIDFNCHLPRALKCKRALFFLFRTCKNLIEFSQHFAHEAFLITVVSLLLHE